MLVRSVWAARRGTSAVGSAERTADRLAPLFADASAFHAIDPATPCAGAIFLRSAGDISAVGPWPDGSPAVATSTSTQSVAALPCAGVPGRGKPCARMREALRGAAPGSPRMSEGLARSPSDRRCMSKTVVRVSGLCIVGIARRTRYTVLRKRRRSRQASTGRFDASVLAAKLRSKLHTR
jgi:hypothetical protein